MSRRPRNPSTDPSAAQRFGPVFVALVVFGLVFLVAHQRPFSGHEPAALATLAGSVLIWLGVLPWLLLWWLAAFGLGSTMLIWMRRQNDGTREDIGRLVSDALPIGGAALMLATWITQWGIGLNRASMWAWIATGVALAAIRVGGLVRKHDATAAGEPSPLPWTVVWVALPLGLYAVAGTLPAGTLWQTEAFGYDVLSYHLNLPKQWLAAGAMIATPHDVYGYLPNLVEATYGLLFALRGDASANGVYVCQAFHVTWAMLAGSQVGFAVFELTRSRRAAWISAALLLAVPWVLVTGTLAYNEAVVLALAAAAWRFVQRDDLSWWARGLAVGLLVGTATLAKLTAGFLVAVPLGLLVLFRFLGHRESTTFRQCLASGVLAGVVGVAVLSPYLARNAAWTGNPVFPFLAERLGAGHWDTSLVDRWNRGHGLATNEQSDASSVAFRRHWLQNAGYGAVGGRASRIETRNIAQFSREFGVPLLWPAALLGAIAASWMGRRHWAAAALTAWVLLQAVFWVTLTHQQSRFLIPTLVPGVVLIGLGLAALTGDAEASRWRRTTALLLGGALVSALSALSLATLWGQSKARFAADGNRLVVAERNAPPWYYADSLGPSGSLAHPVNALPPESRVMVVADTSQLFYLEPELVYASAFDASPLGPVLEAADGSVADAARRLRDAGVTHLWVGWSELRRLHGTYGHDPRVTEDAVRELVHGWGVDYDGGASTLYRVPQSGPR